MVYKVATFSRISSIYDKLAFSNHYKPGHSFSGIVWEPWPYGFLYGLVLR